ncbi:MAG: phosphatase PAP2 family protein [Steroidobacteraceae bacterium]
MRIKYRLRQVRPLAAALLLGALPALALAAPSPGAAPGTPPAATGPAPLPSPSAIHYAKKPSGLKHLFFRSLGDMKAYYTDPLHWKRRNWEYFGGVVAAFALAHHYDTQVRQHFVGGTNPPFGPKPPSSATISDALPGFAAFALTWGYATLSGSRAGKSEAWNMLESAGIASLTGEAMKYAFGRQRPYQTTDTNKWFAGGSSFPSLHVTAAFAIGTVLAESGNPKIRWLRRTIGYGIGIGTAYLRMKHNAHWLSDTVVAAALGMATAHFVLDRRAGHAMDHSTVTVVPVQGGAMLAFAHVFH